MTFPRFNLLVVCLAGWLTQQQNDIIDFLMEENRTLHDLLGKGTIEPYNLSKDPAETQNLARAERQLAEQLHNELKQWQIALNASCPTEPNPAYEPGAARERSRGQRGKGVKSK